MSEVLVRTDSGLANQHLLLGVDLVVFCEGGIEHQGYQDAIVNGSDETHDASFWRTVFELVRPNLVVHVKSVGCRSVAEEIALRVARSQLQAVCVCTDADFDHLICRQYVAVPTVKSWGYSWEADLCDISVSECVFFKLRPRTARNIAIFSEFANWLPNFISSCEQFILADARRVVSGNSGVFDRDNPVRPFAASIGSMPTLDVGHLSAEVAAPLCPGTALPRLITTEISAFRHCFGKMLIKAIYHALSHVMQKARRGKIDFDTFLDLMINCFREKLPTELNKFSYFDGQLSAMDITGQAVGKRP